jgi:hypothetical protein
VAGVTAVGQGALVSLANAAMRENQQSNVRVNEVHLKVLVDYDAVAEEKGAGVLKASDFAKVYEGVLADDKIRGARVTVAGPEDLGPEGLKWAPKLGNAVYLD